MGGWGSGRTRKAKPAPYVAPGVYSNGSATKALERVRAIKEARRRAWQEGRA